MSMYVRYILIIVIAVIFLLIYSKLRYDHKMQKRITEARKYREEKGFFDFQSYIVSNNYIKNEDWIKQKNDGPNPDSLKNPIKSRDYYSMYSGIVKK